MIANHRAAAWCGLLAAWAVAVPCPAQPTLGIPEPGLLLLGSVTNVAGGLPLRKAAVTWQISGGTPVESVTVPATLVAVNGQFFHLARVPFESRSAGPTNFDQTPNVLALTATPTTYTRSAWMGTNPCTFLNPSQATFTFSKADRGKAERVALAVSIPTPNLDSDGDGMPDWAELVAGTDPHDPDSALKLLSDVTLDTDRALVIRWSSVPGKAYAVSYSSDLSFGFSLLASNIVAVGTVTQYRDRSAIGPGPHFYRIQINP